MSWHELGWDQRAIIGAEQRVAVAVWLASLFSPGGVIADDRDEQ